MSPANAIKIFAFVFRWRLLFEHKSSKQKIPGQYNFILDIYGSPLYSTTEDAQQDETDLKSNCTPTQ